MFTSQLTPGTSKSEEPHAVVDAIELPPVTFMYVTFTVSFAWIRVYVLISVSCCCKHEDAKHNAQPSQNHLSKTHTPARTVTSMYSTAIWSVLGVYMDCQSCAGAGGTREGRPLVKGLGGHCSAAHRGHQPPH